MNFNDMDLLEFLNTYEDALATLRDTYHVIIKQKGTRILLKYHQIDTPKCHLTNQCRGTIVEQKDGIYEYVCHGFYRFFNYEEAYASKIDWKTAKVQEKRDGSLIRFYSYEGRWYIATSGTIDAFDAVMSSSYIEDNIVGEITFGQLALKCTLQHEGFFESLHETYTYLFELTSPFNKIVVPYQETKLTFLSSIHTLSGVESFFNPTTVEGVKEYKLSDPTECLEIVKTLDYHEEGYVVVDSLFRRIKVKSPAYVAVHHLRGESTPSVKSMLTMIKTGEDSEFLIYYPEYTRLYHRVTERMKVYTDFLEDKYCAFTSYPMERKDIAYHYGKASSYIFSRMDNRVSTAYEYFCNMSDKKQVEIIEGGSNGRN